MPTNRSPRIYASIRGRAARMLVDYIDLYDTYDTQNRATVRIYPRQGILQLQMPPFRRREYPDALLLISIPIYTNQHFLPPNFHFEIHPFHLRDALTSTGKNIRISVDENCRLYIGHQKPAAIFLSRVVDDIKKFILGLREKNEMLP